MTAEEMWKQREVDRSVKSLRFANERYSTGKS